MPFNDFDTTEKILAFAPMNEEEEIALASAFGATLLDVPTHPESPQVLCLVARRDREGSNDLRPMINGTNADAETLSDGRKAYRGYWTLDAVAAVLGGHPAATILTQEEYNALLPPDPVE